MNRKLFISFTACLRHMSQGKITDLDLANGLFHFGCARDHAMNPWLDEYTNEVAWFYEDEITGHKAHTRLAQALLRAEEEGRCIWRGPRENASYAAINELLLRFYKRVIVGTDHRRMINATYCYPGVRDRIKEAGLDNVVEVIL